MAIPGKEKKVIVHVTCKVVLLYGGPSPFWSNHDLCYNMDVAENPFPWFV